MGEFIQGHIVPQSQNGERLDKALSTLCAELSRARIQALIRDGHVFQEGRPCREAKTKVRTGQHLHIEIPPLKPASPQAEKIPLDIVFEDEHMLVLNKPAGLVVHPGAGNPDGTLVNALLHHCGDSLSGIGGVARPGIVHRLDKETSGLMVVAKTDMAHKHLSAQLQDRSLRRVYHGLVFKVPVPVKGTIRSAIGRDPRHRIKMAAGRKDGKAAVTDYMVLKDCRGAVSLIECRLQTGRMHQIRVHMQSIGHPLLGDPLYGPQPNALESVLEKADFSEEIIRGCTHYPHQALHAQEISFMHPDSGKVMNLSCEKPEIFTNLLKKLEKAH